MADRAGSNTFPRANALLTLAICFCLSAFLRAGEVVAARSGPDDGFGNPIAETATDQEQKTATSPAPSNPTVVGPAVVIAELERQRGLVEQREQELQGA